MNREARNRIKAQAEQQKAAKALLTEIAPTAIAMPTPVPEPAKPKREKKPPGPQLRHLCGHLEPVANVTNRPCNACLNATRQARNARARERAEQRNASKPAEYGRLPDGSSFEVSYSAAETLWRGALTVPGAGTFMAEQGGVFRLLGALDMLYREWKAKQVENPPAASV